MVPVAEHGASRSTASNGSAAPLRDIGADQFGVERKPREIFLQALEPRRRAIDRGDMSARGDKLRGLAARRGA